MRFAILPNGVALGSGENFSYLIYHSPGTGWWLDVYSNVYNKSGAVDWPTMREKHDPVNCVLVRSQVVAVQVAEEYEALVSVGAAERMERAVVLARSATNRTGSRESE